MKTVIWECYRGDPQSSESESNASKVKVDAPVLEVFEWEKYFSNGKTGEEHPNEG